MFTHKRIKLNPNFIPQTKINSKWIIALNVWAKTVKLLEETIGVNPHSHGLDNGFLDMTPNPQATKINLDKLVFIKIKNLVLQRTHLRK